MYVETGVAPDEVVDGVDAAVGRPFQFETHVVVAGLGGEDEPEAAGVRVGEGEEGVHGRLDPAPVVRRGLERGADPVEQLVHVVAQDLEVEVTLGVEVLVEDGLGDPGRDGDAVHAGGVEALVHEHGTGGVDELPTPGAARQAGRPHAHGVRRGRSIGPCHRRLLSSRADPGTSGPDGHYPYRRSADPGDHTACGILESSNRADAEVRG